jgi:hypothetical protein
VIDYRSNSSKRAERLKRFERFEPPLLAGRRLIITQLVITTASALNELRQLSTCR